MVHCSDQTEFLHFFSDLAMMFRSCTSSICCQNQKGVNHFSLNLLNKNFRYVYLSLGHCILSFRSHVKCAFVSCAQKNVFCGNSHHTFSNCGQLLFILMILGGLWKRPDPSVRLLLQRDRK